MNCVGRWCLFQDVSAWVKSFSSSPRDAVFVKWQMVAYINFKRDSVVRGHLLIFCFFLCAKCLSSFFAQMFGSSSRWHSWQKREIIYLKPSALTAFSLKQRANLSTRCKVQYAFRSKCFIPETPHERLRRLPKNWFMFGAVRLSSYGCTQEVWFFVLNFGNRLKKASSLWLINYVLNLVSVNEASLQEQKIRGELRKQNIGASSLASVSHLLGHWEWGSYDSFPW